MDRSSEDAVWRAIVENYGDRADLDDPATATASDSASDGASEDAPHDASQDDGQDGGLATADGSDHEAAREQESAARAEEFEARHEVSESFVPPDPGPLPYVAPSRLIAWAALIGGPLLMMMSLSLGLASIWRFLAAVAFVGGFVYLVVRMPRDPRDPWDDGARV